MITAAAILRKTTPTTIETDVVLYRRQVSSWSDQSYEIARHIKWKRVSLTLQCCLFSQLSSPTNLLQTSSCRRYWYLVPKGIGVGIAGVHPRDTVLLTFSAPRSIVSISGFRSIHHQLNFTASLFHRPTKCLHILNIYVRESGCGGANAADKADDSEVRDIDSTGEHG